jgi:ribosomal-protein-serine acetyltransferase
MKNNKLDRKKIELTDGKITLRPYRSGDVKATYQAIRESLAELAPWLPFAHGDYSVRESRDWIKRRPKDWKKGVAYEFAIFDAGDGTMLGGCGLNGVDKISHCANLGYWVRTGRTSRGVATAAARLLAKWGFETLELKRIEILVAVSNGRSLRVAEKVGAKREGILRSRLNLTGKNEDAAMHSLIPGEI